MVEPRRLPSDTFVENMLIHIEKCIRINEEDYALSVIHDLHERLQQADTPRERWKIIQKANMLYSTKGW